MADDFRTIIDLVNSETPLPHTYAACHAVFQRRMPARSMFVCLEDEAGMRFSYYVDEKDPAKSFSYHPRQGLSGYILATGRRYWMREDDPLPPGFEPVGSPPSDWIGIPLVDRKGKAFGVLAVQTYEPGERYSAEDAAFLEFAAAAISLAVGMSLLDKEIAISRIASLVDDTVDQDELYSRIHQTIASIIPAAMGNFIVARIDEAAALFRAVYWVDEKDADQYKAWPLDKGFSGYIHSVTKRSLLCDTRKCILPEGWPVFGTIPAYFLGVPLFVQEMMIGVIAIQSYDASRGITREDEHALSKIAPYVAQAICRTELLGKFRMP